MLRCASLVALVLAPASLMIAPAWSQEPGQIGHARPPAGDVSADPTHAADGEPPMSIFNSQLRRFKFLLEHDVATMETAEVFMLRYKRPNNPRIVGAYPDARTNSLVVAGPPESEQAIRETLAEWIIESGGLGQSPPLAMQLRVLHHERTQCLVQMAEIEVLKVKAERSAEDKSKAPQLAARLQSFADELETVERQIRVVRKYIDRLDQDFPAAASP
jgi:hypothetical protein